MIHDIVTSTMKNSKNESAATTLISYTSNKFERYKRRLANYTAVYSKKTTVYKLDINVSEIVLL